MMWESLIRRWRYFYKHPPTDLEILEEIYHRYYKIFSEHEINPDRRNNKMYVPVDLKSVAEHFRIDGDIIFGRIYNHLNSKFSFDKSDKTKVPFFIFYENENNELRHQINFPLMASVIAELRDSQNRYLVNTLLSLASIVISIIALYFSALVE